MAQVSRNRDGPECVEALNRAWWRKKMQKNCVVIIHIPTFDNISGWWYTYPSEKYEFVSWDDLSQYMEKVAEQIGKIQRMKKQLEKPLNLQTQTSLSPFAFCWFCPPLRGNLPKMIKNGMVSDPTNRYTWPLFRSLMGPVTLWPALPAASCFWCSALWLSKSQMAKSPQPQNKVLNIWGWLATKSHRKPQKCWKGPALPNSWSAKSGWIRNLTCSNMAMEKPPCVLRKSQDHLPDMSGRKKWGRPKTPCCIIIFPITVDIFGCHLFLDQPTSYS